MQTNGHKNGHANNKRMRDPLEQEWATNPRWAGIERPYTAADVRHLQGSFQIKYTVAHMGAERLWQLMESEPFVRSLGALTGGQAVQMVQAGLKAIYLSGWQVAADANGSSHTYPDQSIYPADSAPKLVKRINNALQRADQIHHMDENSQDIHWMAPIFADAEAGFGGNLNAFELMKAMIEAGAAAVHFEDQLSSAKKCGHMGGKVVVPVQEAINKLVAARLAADVMNVPTIVVARTDAESGKLLSSDIDPRDHPYIASQERTAEGFYPVKNGLEYGIMRALEYAPYADLIWLETSTPNLEQARRFAEAVHAKFPGKKLAYNCSPSFNWRLNLDADTIETFQEEMGKMGYCFQFVTLAGFHNLNLGMFELAGGYAKRGMGAYSEMQNREFDLESAGFKAIKHQSFVGAGYFDQVQQTIMAGQASTTAMGGSTEEAQFMTAHD